jgi:UPF0176 protein
VTVVATLYKFVALPDYRELREPLLVHCLTPGCARHAVAGSRGYQRHDRRLGEGIDAVLAWLRSDPRFADLEHKESRHDGIPFLRMKVKLKREIVTMGVAPGRSEARGRHLRARPPDWNELLDDPEVRCWTRATTTSALSAAFAVPWTRVSSTFRDFPALGEENLDPAVNRKVAMFCTGGIRCEKASSYPAGAGLRGGVSPAGGILQVFRGRAASESAWEGECFVFDERVAVDQELRRGSYDQCYACRHPISAGGQALAALRAGCELSALP